MNLDAIKQVYLIGIGGIGMSGLARYFKHLGCEVDGYDRTETELTKSRSPIRMISIRLMLFLTYLRRRH